MVEEEVVEVVVVERMELPEDEAEEEGRYSKNKSKVMSYL